MHISVLQGAKHISQSVPYNREDSRLNCHPHEAQPQPFCSFRSGFILMLMETYTSKSNLILRSNLSCLMDVED